MGIQLLYFRTVDAVPPNSAQLINAFVAIDGTSAYQLQSSGIMFSTQLLPIPHDPCLENPSCNIHNILPLTTTTTTTNVAQPNDEPLALAMVCWY